MAMQLIPDRFKNERRIVELRNLLMRMAPQRTLYVLFQLAKFRIHDSPFLPLGNFQEKALRTEFPHKSRHQIRNNFLHPCSCNVATRKDKEEIEKKNTIDPQIEA